MPTAGDLLEGVRWCSFAVILSATALKHTLSVSQPPAPPRGLPPAEMAAFSNIRRKNKNA